MFTKKPKATQTDKRLLREIDLVKQELETAYSNFEYATDPDLITSSIYKINAIQEHYAYLIKQAKLQTLTPIK